MLDADLFGLALICDGEYLFAEPDSKLSKYAPKSWRSSNNHGLDANGRPALAFYFRVQFYVDSPLLLRDETTRHHYYLQLRLNTAAGAAAEHTTRLAGLALQADLGDHALQPPPPTYRPEDYVPPAMHQPIALRSVEAAHRALRTLPRQEARARFIATACQLQEPVNAHVFRLRASKAENAPGSLTLAVCARGLRVCQENNPHPSVFLWSSIGKLSFERKKFEIRTGHEKLTLYTTSDDKSRLLLNLCKAAHQFSMAVAPRLTEAKQLHQQQQQQHRQEEEDAEAEEADQHLRWLDCDQRISVISSTSSNTTSGIVSDRVHSEDELEIMITSPPAPSTESLALAHLLDSAPASSRTSAASAAAALGGGGSSVASSMAAILPALVAAAGGSLSGLTSTKELLLDEAVCSDTSAKTLDGAAAVNGSCISGGTTGAGGSSGGAGGRCTAGSQCSSNCSTVVVTPAFTTKSKGRRPSTSSSLELGYSHTAQNSAVSDATCIELDIREPVYGAGGLAPSSHTSGVYTLTSSDQYTLSSASEQYATTSEQYSISTSDSYVVRTAVDQVDGGDGPFRDRSNSNVSNSGSFRGDGSDPTDNQQTLLSADELSDLIVGRYPSCKSVSNTLDSDSDYVTLPSTYHGYAPIPPKRIDSAPRPPPPPYGAQFLSSKLSDNTSELDEILIRDPPPYPEGAVPPPPPVYPSEEATARFITTRPPNILTAHTSLVGISSSPSYSVPPIPPKVPRPTSLISSNSTSALSSSLLSGSSLSIASSKGSLLVPCAFLPPPPPPTPRQPPPPPPLATVYTSQLSRSQIEQYRQQMYSDVDFVVFPLKEPAISKQEYLEAKQGSLLAALAQTQPVFYRSTPYLGRYASSQNLSDTYVQLPVYGAPSIASTGSLEPVPPPLPPNRPSRFMRTQSDDNLLNSVDGGQPSVQLQPPKFRRLPPPPPPPPPETTTTSADKKNALDIRTLRETSKKMDLPLISALCNDRSLIKQTKAFVMPKHPNELLMPRHVSSNSAKMKYPVSGLSSTRMNKVSRKPPSISHRHPGDKLPELPKDSSTKVPSVVTTRATPNNYVFTDPRVKHKTMQSHS